MKPPFQSVAMRLRRPFARLAICVLVLGHAVAGFETHSLGSADDDASVDGVLWAAPAASIGAGPIGAPQPDHCAVCHLKRAFGGVCLAAVSGPWRIAVSGAQPRLVQPARSVAERTSQFSRGPPSSPLCGVHRPA